MLWVLGNGSSCEVLGVVVVVVVVAGLGDPVNIWTTCLKEEVSAWTKVVGYGGGGGGGAAVAVAAAAAAVASW
ncbi:hypothetical protein OIU76_029199 [Salix suchowensis]|uniref:Secreted protein n=1 Tax=Salix suchowensis TaxID=1278906 RepID=A0ABQ9CF07_9ROSI|nr:hypothetical protein OIU76_029199 [Salix suchowensis]KAJ6396868.1 hypothetical protein OIU77_021824 [Salix suchowensis]